MTYCSVVTVLVLVGLTKKRFGHYAILKNLSSDHQVMLLLFTKNLEECLLKHSKKMAYKIFNGQLQNCIYVSCFNIFQRF